MRLEAGLESRATTGSGDAGAHPSSPAEGNELEGSPEHASPGRPQPPAESQPRSELEELRYRLAEQEEQLAWMNEKLSRVAPGPLAPAGQQGGYELTVYQPKSKGISLETGKQEFPHPDPPSGQRSPSPPQSETTTGAKAVENVLLTRKIARPDTREKKSGAKKVANLRSFNFMQGSY